MATTIDELQVQITATQQGFQKEINSVKTQLDSLSGYASKSTKSLSAGMVATGMVIGNVLTSVISAGFQAVASSMDSAIARVDTLNNFSNVMANLGISTDTANKAINYISDQLLGLPTTLDSAATSVQRLVAANGSLEASTQIYLGLNNALLAGGTATETQSAALEQMLQAYSKGKFELQEWRSLLTAMPAQLNQIATAMGYVDSTALYEAMSSGEATMNDFMSTIIRLNNEGVAGFASFAQQARSATNGIATSVTNLKTAFSRAIATIVNTIGASNISGFFNTLSKAIGTAANYIAAFIRVVLTAVNALRALFGQSQLTFGSTSSSAGNAADSVASVGSAADSTAGSLDDATGSAKALKKQLAGFDEMNVLQKTDTSGSSGSVGSSGSAGGVNTGGLVFDTDPFDTSALTDATSEVEKIFQDMMDELNEMFDFSKIGKAFKRFANDVEKFLEPVGKIVGDLWEDYIKPLVSWAGNSLLPAVLNAIGGALQFIGEVLNTFWTSFLKPFIDYFVVPIAQFAGSLIVGALNGIGDALRAMAGCDGIVNAVVAALEALIAYKIVNGVYDLISSIQAAYISFTTFSGSQSVAALTNFATSAGTHFSTLGAKIGTFGASVTNAGGLWSTFTSGLMSAANMVFSPTTIAVEGLVLAMQLFEAATIANEIATTKAHTADLLYIESAELAETTNTNLKDGVDELANAKNNLAVATNSVAGSENNLYAAQQAEVASQQALEATCSKYNLTVDEAKAMVNGLSFSSEGLTGQQKELMQSFNNLTMAQETTRQAELKLKEAQDQVVSANNDISNSSWKVAASEELARIQSMANEGQWYNVAKAIEKVSKSSGEYETATGEVVEMTNEQYGQMAEYIAQQLASVDDENYATWKNIYNSTDGSIDQIMEKIGEMTNETNKKVYDFRSSGNSSGASFGDGVVSGMNGKTTNVGNTAWNLGKNAANKFNASLGIHSPSRVMMKAGGFFSEGIALGISKEGDSVFSEAKKISEGAQKFIDGGLSVDLATHIDAPDTSKLFASSSLKEDLITTIASEISQHITVNVGSKTLVDEVVDGINDRSYLGNRSVINI